MIQDPSDPSSHLPRGALLASFAVILVPAGVLLSPDPPAAAALLWFAGLAPVLLWAYAFRWRGAMTALAVVLGSLVLVEAALLVRALPASPLVLPVATTLLGVGVAVALLMVRVQQDRGTLEEVALTDRLTGLPNRRHARIFLETMFGAAERGRAVALVLFDLDDFRGYNDRMGRREGDEALRAFATLLASSTRRMNLSARLGGEEFISILAGSDEEGARAFADRVRETFRLSRPASRELTLSAGVAAFHPSMRRPDDMVGAADLALFRAKEEGGDRVRVFGRDIRVGEAPVRGEESGAALAAVRPDSPLSSVPAHGTEFARPAELMGRSPPPPELLPPADPRFGTGRLVLVAVSSSPGTEPLRPYLAREGFQVLEGASLAESLLGLEESNDVVLIEADLLGEDTGDLVRATRSRWPTTQILLLRGEGPAHHATDGLLSGVDDVLGLPLDPRALQAALVDALGRRDRRLAETAERHQLPTFSDQTAGPGERLRLRGLLALVRAGELRDPNTRGHAVRVARYSAAILDAMEVEEAARIDREALILACLLHDIGKLEIPEAILVKNAPLTADEFGKVRQHPESGRAILRPVFSDELILAVTGWHHERWDGSGYPDGLAGGSIPLEARIVAIADALDAMSSPRAYRPGLEWDDAVRQIRERFQSHYDPALAEPFRRAQPELLRIYREAWQRSGSQLPVRGADAQPRAGERTASA
jgi:putative two-component system response regulator